MAWSLSLYSLLGVGAAGISAVVAGQAWRNRSQRGARPFIWLMFALGGWSLVYGIQLGFPTATGQLLWQRVSLAIGGTIPTLWLVFTLHYLGRDYWLTPTRLAGLAIDPLLFALFTLTNPLHGFIWQGATLTSQSAGPVLNLSLAAGYYIHIGYAYLIITLGLAFFFSVFERTTPIYRRQTGLLILGVVPPFIGNIAFTFRVSWGPLPALDPTPFLFVLTGVLWTLALYQFDLLDRIPLARQQIIHEMGDGLIVLDAERNIINTNAIVTRVFDPPPKIGQSIGSILPTETTADGSSRAGIDGQTLTARVDGKQRVYDAEWSSLTDEQGVTVGYMIALRDVTERNEYEQRLEVAQRVLRHNLRNKMTVIKGWAETLSETTNGHAVAVQRIINTADELTELSEKTQMMVQMEPSTSSKRIRVDLQSHLSSLVEEFGNRYPDVTIEREVPQSLAVGLPDAKFLRIPVENLIENAIEHNDADDPWVRVSAEAGGDQIKIRVEDNGPPIPEMERTVLREGMEDSLHHGSGLGLWLTYWSIKTVGGRISFAYREPRGNSVTLEVPAAE